ncbi:MAG: pitrilysin family protein [Candidatus Levyibacteriota bacterium]
MKYTKRIFKNRLTLISITDLSTSAVTIEAYVRAGFRFDPIDKPGLSHFTEHIIFNATNSSPNLSKLAQNVERYGGWRSAFTWVENQKHTIHLPKDNFVDGAKLMLGTIFEPPITESEIKKEKGVVKEEILRNKSDPSKGIWDYAWFPLFFQGTSLSRPYSGTVEDISKISKSDVSSFVSSYFRPENVVIFVAGDLEPACIQEVVDKYSKKYTSSSKKENVVPLAPKIKKQVLVHTDASYYQTSIAIGIKTVPFNSQLKSRLDILLDMLSGYFGTPLIQELRDKGGLIYTWYSFQDNLSDNGYLLFNISVDHKNVNLVTKIVLQEFSRFARGDFKEEEVEKAKSHLIGSILANTETGRDYIEWYGLQELLSPKKILHIEDKIKIYKEINSRELKDIASQCFNRNNIFIAAVGSADETSLSKLILEWR